MIGAVIMCLVVSVYDGDGPFHCANGVTIRAAGIQAPDFERASPCRERRLGYTCDDGLAARSQQIAARLLVGKTLTCRKLGRSYQRTVADCALPDGRNMSCTLVQSGAAVEWPRYMREYGLTGCR